MAWGFGAIGYSLRVSVRLERSMLTTPPFCFPISCSIFSSPAVLPLLLFDCYRPPEIRSKEGGRISRHGGYRSDGNYGHFSGCDHSVCRKNKHAGRSRISTGGAAPGSRAAPLPRSLPPPLQRFQCPGALLIVERRFLYYGLSPILYNLGIIFGTLFLSAHFGIMGRPGAPCSERCCILRCACSTCCVPASHCAGAFIRSGRSSKKPCLSCCRKCLVTR